MWELRRHHALWLQYSADTGYETVDIRYLRQDIVGHDQVRTHFPAGQLDTSRLIPEPHLCGDADRLRNRRYIARGFEAEAGNAALNKVPQEVAVIAGQLKDKAPLPQPEALHRLMRERSGMLEPRRRIRGEISVLTKDLIRSHELPNLGQPALGADLYMQRIKHLPRIDLLRCEEGLT